MSSALINGKHYKKVVIDYYDDLIAELDIYAEEVLKKLAYDEYLDWEENDLKADEPDLYYQSIEKQFEDPYNDTYKFDDTVDNNTKYITIKGFINSERMKAIEMIKKLQKERLDELKFTKIVPTTDKEALFGKRFGFLINVDDFDSGWKKLQIKFRLITVIVDFYLPPRYVYFIQ